MGVKMKIPLIIIGALAGLYATFGIVQMIYVLVTSDPGSAYGVTNIAASVVPPAIGLIVCIVCFQKVLAKPKGDDANKDEPDRQ